MVESIHQDPVRQTDTRVGSAGKSDTVVESIHQDPVRQTETRVGSAGKSDAVVESIHRDPVRHTETHVGSAGKSDAGRSSAASAKERAVQRKQESYTTTGSRQRDRRFHDLESAASFSPDEDSTDPYGCMCISTSSVRNEICAALDVLCPRKKGERKMKIKADTVPSPQDMHADVQDIPSEIHS